MCCWTTPSDSLLSSSKPHVLGMVSTKNCVGVVKKMSKFVIILSAALVLLALATLNLLTSE